MAALLLCLPGSALAVSGASDTVSAAQATYPPPQNTAENQPPPPEILGEEPLGTPEEPGGQGAPLDRTVSLPGADSQVQPLADDSGERVIPFTGYVVSTVLLAGTLMLAAGFALRRISGSRATA